MKLSSAPRVGRALLLPFWLASSCSVDSPTSFHTIEHHTAPGTSSSDAVINTESIAEVDLTKSEGESVINTVALSLENQNQLNLNSQEDWILDLEERVEVSGEVSAEKYLKVTSNLSLNDLTNSEQDIGCIYIELRDNITFDKQTLLRVASTGITGDQYDNTSAPLKVKRQSWKEVPILNDSLTLAIFEEESVKSFNGELCFKLDLSNLPAQSYTGQIVVQYLIADGDSRAYDIDFPLQDQIHTCGSEAKVLRATQQALLKFEGLDNPNDFTVRLKADEDYNDLGTITFDENDQLIYTAPSEVLYDSSVFVVATPRDDDLLPEYCEISLISDDNFFEEDDGVSQAVAGYVYKLEKNTRSLPDFSQMTSVSQIMTPNFDVPERSFQEGFPGIDNLIEWFGIRFEGQIYIPQDCDCSFRLSSDDGSRLYIDGVEVIDNDGLHPTRAKDGELFLPQGVYDFQLDYYQGPRYHIALQLLWDLEGDGSYEVIPPRYFYR